MESPRHNLFTRFLLTSALLHSSIFCSAYFYKTYLFQPPKFKILSGVISIYIVKDPNHPKTEPITTKIEPKVIEKQKEKEIPLKEVPKTENAISKELPKLIEGIVYKPTEKAIPKQKKPSLKSIPKVHKKITKRSIKKKSLKQNFQKEKTLEIPDHESENSLPQGAMTQARHDLTGNLPPKYPTIARKNGWEGNVQLRVLVSEEGRAIKIEIVQGSQYSILDQAAYKAILKWRFIPAKRGNNPVQSWIEIPIRFRLKTE